MPRDGRRFRERSLDRRELAEEPPRFRQREVSPPGVSRHREEIRERERWEKDLQMQQRSRSPRNDRRRGRNSQEKALDRWQTDSPPRERELRIGGTRDRELRSRRESPRIEAPARTLFETKYLQPEASAKYVDDRFANRSGHWEDLSRAPALGYPAAPQYHNNQAAENPGDTPGIPEFNPESSKLNSKEWLRLLESIASERDWRQDEKSYIMSSRLSGFARQWYLTSGINCKSWSELKEAFLKSFPTELDYHGHLSKMLGRVKKESETLSAYFLHKVALLNACEIQGVKAVSCIIAGLSNSKMQHQAKMQKCEDPDQLYLFLRSLTQDDHGDLKSSEKKEENHSKAENSKADKWKGKKEKDCYFCGHSGHIVVNCRYIKKHKCSICHELGHECEPLSLLNKRPRPAHNQVMEGSLSQAEVQIKNFMEVVVNGLVLKGYIDFESECITIKEESAIQTRLPIKKQYKVVRGFAGSSLSSIGYIDTAIFVDRAIANVRISVVPDHLQTIPIVVGQIFTQQPHVVVLKDGGKLRFYQRLENGDTNFDF